MTQITYLRSTGDLRINDNLNMHLIKLWTKQHRTKKKGKFRIYFQTNELHKDTLWIKTNSFFIMVSWYNQSTFNFSLFLILFLYPLTHSIMFWVFFFFCKERRSIYQSLSSWNYRFIFFQKREYSQKITYLDR